MSQNDLPGGTRLTPSSSWSQQDGSALFGGPQVVPLRPCQRASWSICWAYVVER